MFIGMIPTYREGKLARDAINSILPICHTVLVYEGRSGGAIDGGFDTDLSAFKKNPRVIVKHGEWESESSKRNAMLAFTRRYPAPVWGIFLDADEIILWPEYLESYIEYCDAQAPEGQINVACPILRIEEDGKAQTLKRIIRLDMLEEHILASSQWKFKTSELAVTFPAEPSDRQPFMGEPHVLHRAFLRPPDRKQFRLSDVESSDFRSLEEKIAIPLGMPVKGAIPKVIDKPQIIVAQEVPDEHGS